MHRMPLTALAVLTLLVPAPGLAQQAVQIPARDRVLQGEPQTLFAIGALEGAEWETFSDVAQVAFDARDNLYVLDRGNHRVLVFDAQGKFVRQLGKQGSGPGEFGSPNGIGIEPDGRVIVADIAHRNYTIFGPDGEFERGVGIVRVTNEGGRSSTSVGGRLPDEQIRQNLANMEFAETVPVIFGLRTDPLGRIWVHRTAEKEYGPGRIDLIAADGRYIGTLEDQTMPDAVSRSGRAAYIERDEFDVERVVVKMLPAGWR